MNCEQFSEEWNAHVAGLLESPDEARLLEHSRACDRCGTKWREHEELSVLLAGVLKPLKPAEGFLARLVDRLPPAPLFRRSPTQDASDAPFAALALSWPLLLAAFLGGMVMYVMSGSRGQSGFAEQLAYAEMMGRGTVGRGGMSTILGSVNFVGTLMSLAFLVWITRASFWAIWFPVRMPAGIQLARWVAIPTIMMGTLQLLISMWILMIHWSNLMFQSRSSDLSLLLMTITALNQFWTLGFWLTLLLLLFSLLNEATKRQARPLQ